MGVALSARRRLSAEDEETMESSPIMSQQASTNGIASTGGKTVSLQLIHAGA